MLATLTSADSGRSQLSLRDSGTVPCFARHCQTTSGSANEVSWEGIKAAVALASAVIKAETANFCARLIFNFQCSVII